MIYRAKGTLCNQKKFQGLEALDPSLGLIFPSQGLTLARQCIILTNNPEDNMYLHLKKLSYIKGDEN